MAFEQDDGRDDEIKALMNAEGVDSAKIAEQVAKKSGKKVAEKIPEIPPDKKPDEQKPPEEKKPEEQIKENVPDPETIKAGMLHEMWGDQFKTVEDFKKANIPAQLQELATLRQKNQELETQLKAKPKHHYANDDIAKLDEFVRATGIKDAGIYSRLNRTDIANMDDMDALILERIIDDPALADKEPQVRRNLERRYNVDSKKVEDGDLTKEELEDNLFELSSAARKAKDKLQDLKGKIKMPEIVAEKDDATKETKWTPEIEAKQKAEWMKANGAMYDVLKKQPIRVKGFKEPVGYFEVPDEAKDKVLANAIDYVISNQLEAGKEEYLKYIAQAINTELKEMFEEERNQVAFERGRSISQKELLELYHNPSKRNDDTPPGGGEELSDEVKLRKAYEAELTR